MFTEQTTVDADPEIAPMTQRRPSRKQRRDARRERDRLQYQARKSADPPQCVKCGAAAAPDSLWCEKHGAAALEQARVAAKRTAAHRRDRGECEKCGQPRSPKGGRKSLIPTSPISHGVTHAARIADRTRRDAEGRSRFHGKARKGPPTASETDAWDLRTLRAELELAAAAVEASHSPDVAALPRIQRAAIVQDALSHLGLLERQLDELVDRLKRRLR